MHFEILRKGQRIDPLKAKVATGNDLTDNQLVEFKRIVKKVDNIKATELVATEKKKEEVEAKKTVEVEIDKKNEANAATLKEDPANKPIAAETTNKNNNNDNVIFLPNKADVFSGEQNALQPTEQAEKVVEEKKVSQPESVQKTDSMANRKLIYPPKTPAKKKRSLQAANAKSMNIYRSVSRKPKRK